MLSAARSQALARQRKVGNTGLDTDSGALQVTARAVLRPRGRSFWGMCGIVRVERGNSQTGIARFAAGG